MSPRKGEASAIPVSGAHGDQPRQRSEKRKAKRRNGKESAPKWVPRERPDVVMSEDPNNVDDMELDEKQLEFFRSQHERSVLSENMLDEAITAALEKHRKPAPKLHDLGEFARASVLRPENFKCRYTGGKCATNCSCWYKFQCNLAACLQLGLNYDVEGNLELDVPRYHHAKGPDGVAGGEEWLSLDVAMSIQARAIGLEHGFVILNPQRMNETDRFHIVERGEQYYVLDSTTNISHTYPRLPANKYLIRFYDQELVWCYASFDHGMELFSVSTAVQQLAGYLATRDVTGKDATAVRNKLKAIVKCNSMPFTADLIGLIDDISKRAVVRAVEMATEHSEQMMDTRAERHEAQLRQSIAAGYTQGEYESTMNRLWNGAPGWRDWLCYAGMGLGLLTAGWAAVKMGGGARQLGVTCGLSLSAYAYSEVRRTTRFVDSGLSKLNIVDSLKLHYAKRPIIVEDTCCADYEELEVPELETGAFIDDPEEIKCAPGPGVQLLGYGAFAAKPYWPRQCYHNERLSLTNRVLFKIKAEEGLWRQAYDRFNMQFHNVNVVSAMEFEDFVQHVRGAKRKEYIKADADLFRKMSISTFPTMGFLKDEFSVGKPEGEVVPRFISGKGSEYAVEVGRYIYPLTQYLKKECFGLNMDNQFIYAGGNTAEELGDFIHQMEVDGWIPYENDFSKWDGHLSEEALECEMDFYEQFGLPDHIMSMLRSQLVSKGRTMKGGIKFSCRGKRASGVPNTTLGNTLLNFMIHNFVLGDIEFKLICMGDDCIIFVREELDEGNCVANFKRFGMKAKLFTRTYDTLEFCSARFWRNGNTRIMGPKPGRIIARTFYDKQMRGPKAQVKLLRGQVVGLKPAATYVPVLSHIIPHMYSQLGYGDIIRTRQWEGKITCSKHNFDPAAIDQWCEIYGLSEHDYWEFVRYVEGTTMPALLDHYVLDRMLEVDIGCDLVQQDHDRGDFQPLNVLEKVSPLLEEVLKWSVWPATWVIPLVESYCLGEGCGTASLRLFLHSTLAMISRFNLPLGIVAHYSLNWYLGGCVTGHHLEMNIVKNSNSKKRSAQRARAQKGPKGSVKTMIKKAIGYGIREGLTGLGGHFMGSPGATVGRRLGGMINKITGFGDYKVSGNSLVAGATIPSFDSGRRGVTLTHREFLCDLTGSAGFNAKQFVLNPGIRSTFPWLSDLGNRFEQYRIRGMVFEFVSTSADALNSTNTALGTVIMSTQYNVYRPAFTSKMEMESYEFTVSGRPSANLIHPIECAPSETPFKVYYIRNAPISDGADLRMYDHGVFTIATVGMQAAATIGELWVSYDVELLKPRIIPGFTTPYYAKISNTNYTNTEILGPIQTANTGMLPIVVTATGGGYDTISLPEYLVGATIRVTAIWSGSSTASLAISWAPVDMVSVNKLKQDTAASVYNSTSTAAVLMRESWYTITGPAPKIVMSSATLPTSGAYVDVMITCY